MTPEGQGTGPTLIELLARAVDTFEAMERMSGAHVRKWYSDSAEATRAAAARLREEMGVLAGGIAVAEKSVDKSAARALRRDLDTLERINGGPVLP